MREEKVYTYANRAFNFIANIDWPIKIAREDAANYLDYNSLCLYNKYFRIISLAFAYDSVNVYSLSPSTQSHSDTYSFLHIHHVYFFRPVLL